MAALAPQNAQGEYYLPDLVGIYRRRGLGVSTLTVRSADEIRGVNSRRELAEVSRLVRNAKNEELLAAGVTLIDPATTYVEADVQVGADTVIHPNVYLEGRTIVGVACEIHAGSAPRQRHRRRSRDHPQLLRHHRLDGRVRRGAGPVRAPAPRQRRARREAHVGNFVELKKATLGRKSKASHLTYLGDATIGDNVNIGAGTITCNYDGKNKHPTVIGDGAFIGSDSQLIAPGHDRPGRLRRRRLVDHRRRARRGAGHHARTAGEQGGVGTEEEGADVRCTSSVGRSAAVHECRPLKPRQPDVA